MICRFGKHTPPVPLFIIRVITELFAYVQIDIVGLLPMTTKGIENIDTLIYLATRYVHGVAPRKVSAKITCNILSCSLLLIALLASKAPDGWRLLFWCSGVSFKSFVPHSVWHILCPFHITLGDRVDWKVLKTVKATLIKLYLESYYTVHID